MSFGFSLFVSHYAPVSFPCDSIASSYNRDGNSYIYVENRDFSQHFSMISLDPCNHAVRPKQFYRGYSPCFLSRCWEVLAEAKYFLPNPIPCDNEARALTQVICHQIHWEFVLHILHLPVYQAYHFPDPLLVTLPER